MSTCQITCGIQNTPYILKAILNIPISQLLTDPFRDLYARAAADFFRRCRTNGSCQCPAIFGRRSGPLRPEGGMDDHGAVVAGVSICPAGTSGSREWRREGICVLSPGYAGASGGCDVFDFFGAGRFGGVKGLPIVHTDYDRADLRLSADGRRPSGDLGCNQLSAGVGKPLGMPGAAPVLCAGRKDSGQKEMDPAFFDDRSGMRSGGDDLEQTDASENAGSAFRRLAAGGGAVSFAVGDDGGGRYPEKAAERGALWDGLKRRQLC